MKTNLNKISGGNLKVLNNISYIINKKNWMKYMCNF
jgi:hypothetical protein